MKQYWKHYTLKTLAVLAVIGMLLVILAGAVVTKTGSGDGCGANWPLCHGQLIPSDPTLETLIEYTHRLITGVVGLLVLLFSVWMAVRYRQKKEVVWVAVASIFFLLLQSILGALAVVYGQSKAVMALHFGFSLLSYASVYVLALLCFQLTKRSAESDHIPLSLPVSPTTVPRLRHATFLLFVWTYIVVYLGALVRHTDSELACYDWPLCNGRLIPDLTDGYIAVQFTHRVAALVFFLAMFLYLSYVIRHHWDDLQMRFHGIVMFGLALVQVVSGGIVVLSNISTYASLTHALVITILFGFMAYTLLYVYRRSPLAVNARHIPSARPNKHLS